MSGLTDKVLLWLNDTIIQSDPTVQQILDQLHQFIHQVHVFTSPDSCVDFSTDIDQQHVFLIISYSRAQQIIHHIHPIASLCNIYIIVEDSDHHSSTWIEKWQKIRGVYPNIPSIYNDLSIAVKQDNQDVTPWSILSSFEVINNTNLDCLEPSFMYTQLFKETLLNMNHDKQSREDFISFCRERPNLSNRQKELIDEFERDYSPDRAIWWYTRESFVYQMLNQALRLLQADIIIMMGFFIVDLHRQIERLYEAQYHIFDGKTMTVYRGQRLSSSDFDKLMKARNGLMSFNNFLSTSRDDKLPLVYAESAAETADMYGILFVITVDPTENAPKFADVRPSSYFPNEDEILFSMHTVFRIEQIVDGKAQERLKHVLLTLIDEDDEQLQILSNHIRNEMSGKSSTQQLSELLINTNQPNMIEKLYRNPQPEGSGYEQIFDYYYYHGFADLQRGRHSEACSHLEQAITVIDENSPTDFNRIATIYAMLASAYVGKGEYWKALTFHERALEIEKKIPCANHSNLAKSYGNIALVYTYMGEYSKALLFYEQALEIQKESLPVNHPDIATSYGNIALVYYNKGEYSKALSFQEQAFEIKKSILPANHPSLPTSYANIALVYFDMGEYSKALSVYEQALEIIKETLPENHLSLTTIYGNIASVYFRMGEYSEALTFYEQALEIEKKSLPANHPYLAISYGNIALVYTRMDEYSEALVFHEKALEIQKKSLPTNHPSLATSYNNIASLYCNMEEYLEALSFYEKALEIMENSLPANHPHLATSYANIASVYSSMGEYSKALLFHGKALEIRKKSLRANHPHLVTSYLSIGVLNLTIGLPVYAERWLTKALSIMKLSMPPEHPEIQLAMILLSIASRSTSKILLE